MIKRVIKTVARIMPLLNFEYQYFPVVIFALFYCKRSTVKYYYAKILIFKINLWYFPGNPRYYYTFYRLMMKLSLKSEILLRENIYYNSFHCIYQFYFNSFQFIVV